jgi:hypothetical protein
MYLETRIKKLSVANKKKILKGLPMKICSGDGDCILLTKTQHKQFVSKGSLEISCSLTHCKKLHNFYNKNLIGGGVGGYGSMQGRKVSPEPVPQPVPVPQPIAEAKKTKTLSDIEFDDYMNEFILNERRKRLGEVPTYKREPAMDFLSIILKKKAKEKDSKDSKDKALTRLKTEARIRRKDYIKEKKERVNMSLNDKYDFR